MPSKIEIGTSYFVAFANGQNLVAVANYFATAPNLDTNFATLRSRINTIIDELRAINGPNNVYAQDMLFLDDPTITTVTTLGRIGTNAIRITANVTLSLYDYTGGTLALNGARTVSQGATGKATSLSGAPVDTVFFNMDVNGVVNADPTSGVGGTIPIATLGDVTDPGWDGADLDFVNGPFVDLMADFFDGDEYFQMLGEPALTPFNTTGNIVQVDAAHVRMNRVSKMLGGWALDDEAVAIGPLGMQPGLVTAPSLRFTDGLGVLDAFGWFRNVSNAWAYSNGTSNILELDANGLTLINGTAMLPSLAFLGSPTTGLFRKSAGVIGFSCAATEALALAVASLRAGADGTAALPYFTRVDDLDTGMFFGPAVDVLGLSTAGNLAVDINALGRVDHVLKPYGRVSSTTLVSVLNSGVTEATWDTTEFDNRAQRSTNVIVVGAGFDGRYLIAATCDWRMSDASAAGVQVLMEIVINGITVAQSYVVAHDASKTVTSSASVIAVISGGQDIRIELSQDDASNSINVRDRQLSWSYEGS